MPRKKLKETVKITEAYGRADADEIFGAALSKLPDKAKYLDIVLQPYHDRLVEKRNSGASVQDLAAAIRKIGIDITNTQLERYLLPFALPRRRTKKAKAA